MNISDYKFTNWASTATVLIGFGPDRKKVQEELLGHMQDHYDVLIAEGMPEEEACDQVLACMGDAIEVAPQLAAVHRPFWGYFLRASWIAVIVLLCLCIIPACGYVVNLELGTCPSLRHRDADLYVASSYGGDTGRTLHHLSEPTGSFTTDGSTFTLTDAVVFTQYNKYQDRDITHLYVLIRQKSLIPWQAQSQYSEYFPVSAYFTAVDSLGNEYPCYFDALHSDESNVNALGYQSGIFTYTHECWINDFPAEAQWVDIRYERDGRNYSLRIDLTGGDQS